MDTNEKHPHNALLQSFIAERAMAKGASVRSVCREVAGALGVSEMVVVNWHYGRAGVSLMLIWASANSSKLAADLFDLYLAAYQKRAATKAVATA